MNDKTKQALELALEALEGMYIEGFTQDDSPINNAITAIREALADHLRDATKMIEHRAYSWKYDAYFYPDKNEWEEPRCCDMACEYCKDRPARPLDDEAAHWDMLYETDEAIHD